MRCADAAKESIAILGANNTVVRSGQAVLPIYSLTKTFIAACVVQSKIDLNTPISRWIDRSWVADGEQISVAHLLSHTSGIADYFSTSKAYSDAVANGDTPWSDETYADHTLRAPRLFATGTNFAYSNPGYWLLGQILVKELASDMASIIDACVAQPLGLESLHWAKGRFANDLPNYPAEWVWHGLLLASADDVARFMASPMIDALREPLTLVPGGHPSWRHPHYGLGLMVEPNERFGHNGEGPGFSASCYRFPTDGHTICVLTRTSADTQEEAAMRRLLELHAEVTS